MMIVKEHNSQSSLVIILFFPKIKHIFNYYYCGVLLCPRVYINIRVAPKIIIIIIIIPNQEQYSGNIK